MALTRAEDRLCVCGYRQNTAAKDESWYGICKRSLAQLGSDDGAGNVVYETPQRLAVNAEESSESKKFIRPDFPWMTQPAPEENPLAKPYTPSRPDEDDSDVALVSPIVMMAQTVISGDGLFINCYNFCRMCKRLIRGAGYC